MDRREVAVKKKINIKHPKQILVIMLISTILVTVFYMSRNFRYKVIFAKERIVKCDGLTGRTWFLKKIPHPDRRGRSRLI